MRARRSIWHSATCMFSLEPEGCYHCTQYKVIGPTPLWVSMEHRWKFLKPFWLSANIAMLNEVHVGPIEWHFSSNSTKEYNTAPQHTHHHHYHHHHPPTHSLPQLQVWVILWTPSIISGVCYPRDPAVCASKMDLAHSDMLSREVIIRVDRIYH